MNLATASAVSFVVASAITGSLVNNTNPLQHTESTKPKAAVVASTAAPKQPEPVAAEPATPPAPTPVYVTVVAGDTLSAIATAHDTTYTRLFDANTDIANPNVINVGQQVRIPDPSEEIPARELPQAAPAPVAQAAPVAKTASYTTRRTASVGASVPVVGNDAKAFIYARESGNNPNATNPNGCYGLGQDCNGVVRNMCGADYACQDEYFTNYAMRRYGSWEGAVAFWQTHHWW